ncbi:DNA-processing protein DprA [Aidingimonas halophila]|uniref:DNA protecting protein DprA n=1 Tax=Aidingimonas halophila TaxID=574349 RepID=A0A1H2ZLJ0_9GAMM|nr:DNA-processing protein DprA [Aidingimonas halophila]GHC16283.1 DNA processing protein DprA [Aidingimonas halophila]SDX18245.1 DNA protecting protein DprA [Aidingimonas halophila]
MTAKEWLIVAMLPGLGARGLSDLMMHRPDWPAGWLACLKEPARSALRLWLDHPEKSSLQSRVDALETWLAGDVRRHLLHPEHPDWPTLLNQIPDPPAVLWAYGDLAALAPPCLAMVGTRRPTREGLGNAAGFSRELADRGWCIVSGMALGIDGQAQRAALDSGGRTVAVLGCGVDVVYPPRHADLHQRLIDEGGLLLSEHPPGTRSRPAYFPRRNRIVTGLSLGVLVVEAADRSGSLVSARLATEQNRDVFAIPGSIHNPQASGCLTLIRDGAVLVTRVDDILAELGHWAQSWMPGQQEQAATDTVEDTDPLLAWLSDTPTPLDALVNLTGNDVSSCQLRLLELELEGRVCQASGGWIRLPRSAGK